MQRIEKELKKGFYITSSVVIKQTEFKRSICTDGAGERIFSLSKAIFKENVALHRSNLNVSARSAHTIISNREFV